MTRLVSKIVTAARDRHAAFDHKHFPDAMLYRFLADYAQEAQGKIVAIDPTYGVIEITLGYSLPLTDFEAGLYVGPGRLVNEVVALDKKTPVPNIIPIDLISRDQRFHRNGPRSAAWQEGEVVYLRGPESRFSDIGSIQIQVIEAFGDADVLAMQQPGAFMPLPDASALMVTEALAHFMARRGTVMKDVPPIDVSEFARARADAEQRFYDSVADRQIGRAFFTADVMDY